MKPHEVRQLSTRLESELVKIGGFKVVERTKIDELMKEQKLQLSGCVEECLIDAGKILGANQIILGSVGELGGLYTISVKIVDAETGEMINSSNYDADDGLGQLLKLGIKAIAYDITSTFVIETIPIYQYYHKEEKCHLLSKNPNASHQWKTQGIEFYGYEEQVEGTVPIYQFYSTTFNHYYFTKNSTKKGKWEAQGIKFYAYEEQVDGTVPVYQFYFKWHRDYLYTINSIPLPPERPVVPPFVTLKSKDTNWKAQGIGFYAYPKNLND